MPVVSDQDLLELSNLIIANIKNDFSSKYLSKNLINTIKVEKTAEGFAIIIPAEIYNMYKFFKEGVIIPTGKGSYASELNENGSAFMYYPKNGKRRLITPHNHKGYVDNAIQNAITTWRSMMSSKYDIKNIQGL